ncbi:MAG: class I SAM-dependent methyltransferase [Anaerolineaceae bacterium]|nr:class I SAM-dependent methyltransferase [Anaerolineaceae bacterium]
MSFGSLLHRYLKYLDVHVTERNQETFLDCLEPDAGALVLDCGCHAGYNARKRGDAKGLKSIVGLERNLSVTREASERGIWIAQADLNCPMPLAAASLDVVMVSDVLEHLVELSVFVGEAFRVLKPGGYAVISTPNLASWHNIFALLIGIQPFSGPHLSNFAQADLGPVRRLHEEMCQALADEGWAEGEGDPAMYRHIVVGAYRSLCRLFVTEGFHLERVIGVGYHPLPPLLERVMTRLDRVHANHLVFKLRKPPVNS